MAGTPDHSYIVTQMAGEPEYAQLLVENTEGSITVFMTEAAKRLSQHDAEWGYLSCPSTHPHITEPNGAYVSNDAVCYQTTLDAVSILKNPMMLTPATTQWVLRKKTEQNEWLEVTAVSSDPKLDDLERRVKALEQNAIQFGQTVALQADGGLGKYLCADEGGPSGDNERFNLESRSTVGPWESWKTRKGTGEGTVG